MTCKSREVVEPIAPAAIAWRPALAMLVLATLVCGCGKTSPPQFQLNQLQIRQANLEEPQQQELATVLEALYGTPDEPFAVAETGLDRRKLELAAGASSSDAFGQQMGLFRRHCSHCHGVTGDGAGPTAQFLNPYPRDYRQGIFKFKSTERPARPTRADLRNVLMEGIPGTAMPSFRLLPPHEQEALVEYVMYLSMRGETEIKVIQAFVDLGEDEKLDESRAFLVDDLVTSVATTWKEANEQVIRPNPEFAPKPDAERDPVELAQSVDAGRELFYGEKKGNCIKCHGPSALGDGQTNDYDDWGKAFLAFEKTHEGVTPAEVGLLPLRTVRPRNLRSGVYRGGRRPLDLYRRIHAGINGVPMPNNPFLSPQEIWQIVDYVRSLPYEPASRPPKIETAMERPRM